MNKFYIIFLIAIFSSIVLNPLFVKDGIPDNFGVISRVLGQESDGGDSGDDGGDSGDDGGDSGDDGGDSGDDGGDSGDDGGDSGDEETTDEETTDEETTDEETTDEETTDEETTDEETTDETDDEKCNENETTDEETTDEETTDEETTDEETTDEEGGDNKQSDVEKEESTGLMADGEEYTLLDKIISDQVITGNLINDEATDPGIVSTLVELKQEQAQNPAILETCGSGVENNPDDTTPTASDEGCSPTAIASTAANSTATVNSDTTITNTTNITSANSTDTSISNITITNNNTAATPSPICNIGADNSTNGTIDQAGCTLPTPETCSNGIDNNTTGTINCPILQPTVVIESAVDEVGNALSPDDLITPQKVTFTFSAQANETTQNLEEQGSQDYQFECALDDESFSACSSPMTYTMEKGTHDFVVRLVS